jgi:hypothetical protein
VISILHPWIDAGGAGTLTLTRLEERFGAKELARLERPGNFFDFTRYRPVTRVVDGERELTIPNTVINYAIRDGYPDLLFCHLLEPHAMAEDYIASIIGLFTHFGVKRHCRVGAMWNAVPHTRPLMLTGVLEEEARERIGHLVTQRQSTYEGPTSIMGLLNQEQERLNIASMSLMTHLPQYLQLDEDFTGAARLLEAVGVLYGMPLDFPEAELGERQYRQVNDEMENNHMAKDLVTRLERQYDSRDDDADGGESSEAEPPPLAPDIQQFLRDLGRRLDD